MAQRVLITAGASGIGLAMARAFEAAGAEVWIADADAAALGAVSDLRGSHVDVSDEDQVAALFAAIAEIWGGLDVLCANAGTAGPTALIEDQPLDGWNACLGVTLGGAFLSAKYAAPMMKAAGAGAMIFTSSTAGQYGFPNRAPYAAAKWGVNGLMKTVAMELGPYGIRANAICPGPVEGPRMDGVIDREAAAKGVSPEAIRAGYVAGSSMRSFVTGADVAAMAVFLASPAARLVSGQIIAVDGHTENPDPKP
ncbi:SDR family oxidoreductase [Ovoidimarina sediminis]|uniref:SDR family oxidoreductase n=1 Tax=Ovoidimarina sediminis TaxID=3079856 RepID=UPI00290EF055|nr:SDR family oxidoreductase [Rhodophyticola sp. MJ-SS7]MDU8942826.1 SDR family oxidoreductase [Rhodophyticola sp. MJ-SS7]